MTNTDFRKKLYIPENSFPNKNQVMNLFDYLYTM